MNKVHFILQNGVFYSRENKSTWRKQISSSVGESAYDPKSRPYDVQNLMGKFRVQRYISDKIVIYILSVFREI